MKDNYYKRLFKQLFHKLSFTFPLILLFVIYVSCLIAYVFIEESKYLTINLDQVFIKPNLSYPFGTNNYGQNQFYLVLIATFNTLNFSVLAMLANIILGVTIGIIWGNNKKMNSLMFMIKGIVDNIPLFFLYLIIASTFKGAHFSLFFIAIIFSWINVACLIRNNIIHIKEKDFNKVSKLYKTSFLKTIINNYLPSLLPILFNSCGLIIREIISLEITLSYFGVPFWKNNLSLGGLLYSSLAKNSSYAYPYLFLIPFIILFIINMCFFYISKSVSSLSIKEEDLHDYRK